MSRSMPIDVSFCIQCNWRCKFMTFFRILTHEYVFFFVKWRLFFAKYFFMQHTMPTLTAIFLLPMQVCAHVQHERNLLKDRTFLSSQMGRANLDWAMPWRKNVCRRRTFLLSQMGRAMLARNYALAKKLLSKTNKIYQSEIIEPTLWEGYKFADLRWHYLPMVPLHSALGYELSTLHGDGNACNN